MKVQDTHINDDDDGNAFGDDDDDVHGVGDHAKDNLHPLVICVVKDCWVRVSACAMTLKMNLEIIFDKI